MGPLTRGYIAWGRVAEGSGAARPTGGAEMFSAVRRPGLSVSSFLEGGWRGGDLAKPKILDRNKQTGRGERSRYMGAMGKGKGNSYNRSTVLCKLVTWRLFFPRSVSSTPLSCKYSTCLR